MNEPRQEAESIRKLAALIVLMFCYAAAAQTQPTAPDRSAERVVKDRVLISNSLPAAEFKFEKSFRYVGGQVVNLYGVADAEQHLFVEGKNAGPVERFYWVQFEHYLPDNDHTYKYKPDRTTEVGGFQFIYDIRGATDYAAWNTGEPASDGAAMARLLAQHDLAFPKRAARLRMFYLPTPDRRTELMIIYGEALADESPVPVSADGSAIDTESPEAAKMILQHMREGITITKR